MSDVGRMLLLVLAVVVRMAVLSTNERPGVDDGSDPGGIAADDNPAAR